MYKSHIILLYLTIYLTDEYDLEYLRPNYAQEPDPVA